MEKSDLQAYWSSTEHFDLGQRLLADLDPVAATPEQFIPLKFGQTFLSWDCAKDCLSIIVTVVMIKPIKK